jgi:hypothetical protein
MIYLKKTDGEMATTATGLRRTEDVERLPDGIYDGIWGGYVVRFSVNGSEYEAKTGVGIRTPCAPCKVTSKDGKLTVESK